MKLLDADILLHAHNTRFPQHETARDWLEKTLSESELVFLAWVTILAFLRVSSNPRAFPVPLSIGAAVALVSGWLERPNVGLLGPGDRHWQILQTLLNKAQARGNLVTDAHLAALAIEHGATLCTNDRDFGRFPGLRTLNPLE